MRIFKAYKLLAVLLLCGIISSCEYVDQGKSKINTEINTATETEITDIEQEQEQQEETIIKETTMLNPISEYQNYFFTKDGKLHGLKPDGQTEEIKVTETKDGEDVEIKLSDFFTKSGTLYFTVQESETTGEGEDQKTTTTEIFFKQFEGVVHKVEVLPTKPAVSRVQEDNGEFTIKNFTWNGKICSDVQNVAASSGIERFYLVDSFSYFAGFGLFFYVADGRYNDQHMIRDKGLYYWPVNRQSLHRVGMSEGVIW